jgi:hypothetical protein
MMEKNSAFNLIKGFCVCFIVSPAVNGFEISADLYTDVDYSNNIERNTTNSIDDVSQRLGLNLGVNENRKRFNVDANITLEEEHYYNNTYSDQTSFTTGFGIFNFNIIENFLSWRTAFTRTDVLINSSEKDTPDNRQKRDVLRTGPTVNYRISTESLLSASSNYTLVENEDPDATDTERLNSSLGYSYDLNSTTSISLNGNYNEMLDAEEAEELKSRNINFGLFKEFAQGSFKFNYGRTQAWSDVSDKTTGNFFDIDFTRNQLFWHDLIVQYQQDISDTSIGFESDEAGFNAGTGQPNLNTPEVNSTSTTSTGLDILQRKRLNISINRIIDVYQYTVLGSWSTETYKVQNDDKKSRGLSLILNQNIWQNLTAGFTYEFELDNFVDQPAIGKEKINTYRFNSQYGLSKSIAINAYLQYEARSNNTNQIREYEEFSTGFSINWTVL